MRICNQHTMNPEANNYHSYLLRLWQVQDNGGSFWRASLEEVQTGELQGFPDLNALLGYLERLAFTNQEEKTVLELQPD